jgi:hypothetical protein
MRLKLTFRMSHMRHPFCRFGLGVVHRAGDNKGSTRNRPQQFSSDRNAMAKPNREADKSACKVQRDRLPDRMPTV